MRTKILKDAIRADLRKANRRLASFQKTMKLPKSTTQSPTYRGTTGSKTFYDYVQEQLKKSKFRKYNRKTKQYEFRINRYITRTDWLQEEYNLIQNVLSYFDTYQERQEFIKQYGADSTEIFSNIADDLTSIRGTKIGTDILKAAMDLKAETREDESWNMEDLRDYVLKVKYNGVDIDVQQRAIENELEKQAKQQARAYKE